MLSGCQTAEKEYSKFKEGQWNVEAKINNPQNKIRRLELNLNIAAIRDERFRIDALGPFGGLVGSVIVGPKKAVVLDYKARKAFRGPADEVAMEKLINVPIHPQVFFNLLFDEPIREKGWACVMKESSTQVEKCTHLRDGIVIQWGEKVLGGKTLSVTWNKIDIDLKFKSFDQNITNKAKRFRVKIPSSYSVKNL